MNNLMIFEGKEVEVFEFEGKILFNPKHVAECLEISDVNSSIRKFNDNQVVKLNNSKMHNMQFRKLHNTGEIFLTESGVYKLIFKSRKEEAERFQDWVTDEVLPSIRKTGTYNMVNQQSKDSYMIDNPIERAKRWIEEQKEKEQLQLEGKMKDQVIKELKPKADYTDMILKNKGLVTITQIAKDYGMSGKEMNKILHERGIQYKQSGQWLLYKQYQGKGYTHSETIDITRSDGMTDVKMTTKWTQKGRLFLYDLLKVNNILPDIEKEYSYQTSMLG
ncbi:TPA: phage antirepressor [Clostridioides difficile]|uniref:phage antirepressor KilAC domain-containing protein n=2 Tax=Clostridioides difficile TaxID=1496 RepID=UPI000410660E|nr:phage antirepressor KilAC domain-containing protein [Clostridioides difficile]EII6834308.1 phage antirepressor KilAC domain-containing protein [Clostridioides difficile]EIJ0739591.1 phage antirepressor KilAC domain-containing protein [Clostridioides difficile]EKS7087285.1 phage antirepressor KilAC domain-containing protein [Clostridioides difficile]MBF4708433.1 phage antirepressor KilAC domain-containing protein [Clostridioides difficile]MBF9869653.1 phage antirepressor KilAC domain-contain